jgi:hypothetical protein
MNTSQLVFLGSTHKTNTKIRKLPMKVRTHQDKNNRQKAGYNTINTYNLTNRYDLVLK